MAGLQARVCWSHASVPSVVRRRIFSQPAAVVRCHLSAGPSRPANCTAPRCRPASLREVQSRTRWGAPGVARGRQVACTAAGKKRVVFLGTPDVAAATLGQLLDAAEAPESAFEVSAVVTQPQRARGRGKKVVPSPVAKYAAQRGIAQDAIWEPASAKDDAFLAQLQELGPDLCITVAYGNFLPSKFLAIPRHGTLNVHPSLLPAFRGAAPVPRAVEAGLAETGVTVAFTVLEMDAGPVLRQITAPIGANETAPELLDRLMAAGMQALIEELPRVWSGEAEEVAVPQDGSKATHAAKISREESFLDFSLPAAELHNRVRAFAGWPGTTGRFVQRVDGGGDEEVNIKVVRTEPSEGGAAVGEGGLLPVAQEKDALVVPCGAGTALRCLEVQAPGKKAMAAQAYINGLKARKASLFVQH
ncbi:unnamed protein product [Pedinophyceae sp. YPF-701]|nr:unnamed protein product [Pedinophyceae sp. YPF-701]